MLKEAYDVALESLGPDDSITIMAGLQVGFFHWFNGRFGLARQPLEDGLERVVDWYRNEALAE